MPSHEYLTKLLLCARVSGQKLNSCVRACRCGRYHSTILSLSPIFNFVWLCLEEAMLILSSLIFSTFLVEKTLSSFFFCLLVWENTGGFSGGNERGKKIITTALKKKSRLNLSRKRGERSEKNKHGKQCTRAFF